MEPVCEAKFSENSYGFRPNHSVEERYMPEVITVTASKPALCH